MFFRRKIVLVTLLFGAIFLFATVTVYAGESVRGYTGTVGENITITTPVDGDLFVAANVLKIEAPVAGDVFAAAGTVVIDAPVQGSVRVAAQTLLVRKSIGGSLAVWGSDVHVIEGATIGRYLWADVDSLDLKSAVQGDVIYWGATAPLIASEARIGGKTSVSVRPIVSAWQKFRSPAFLFQSLIALFGLYIVGLVLVLQVRRPTAAVMSAMIHVPLQSLAIGGATLFGTPLIILVLAVTLIGIPVALILMVLYGVLLYLTQVFVALTIGFQVMQWADGAHRFRSFLWTLVIGGLVWGVLTAIPFVGWTIRIIGTIWAFGAAITVGKTMLMEFNTMPSPADGKKE
ncbi:hypothetical protein HY629_00190 [Candidatus Uhrbacteria bacterium]|nr:hypothetical protein [Candidatus Uhrbacteria bacterium]